MTDLVLISIIGGGVTLVVTFSTLFVNYKIEKIHRQINSRMDELLALNRKSSKAEGNLEGRAEEKKKWDTKNKIV